jgi:hypothetical protein
MIRITLELVILSLHLEEALILTAEEAETFGADESGVVDQLSIAITNAITDYLTTAEGIPVKVTNDEIHIEEA